MTMAPLLPSTPALRRALPRQANAEGPVPLPAAATVERALVALMKLQGATALSYALGIGRIVVEVFYDGDPQRMRARDPRYRSLRSLARHPGLPCSAATLYRALGP